MLVQVENLTQKPVYLRLNSGKTLHLAPGKRSPQVSEFELQKNDKVKKLEDLRVVKLHTVNQGKTPADKAKNTDAKPETAVAKVKKSTDSSPAINS